MRLHPAERFYVPAQSSRRGSGILLAEIRALIGVEATAALIAHYGGVRLFIPPQVQLAHPLAVARFASRTQQGEF